MGRCFGKWCIFVKMKVNVFEQAAALPKFSDSNFFQSRELMELCEHTSLHKPYMAVAYDDKGVAVAHLLAIVRSRRSWMPPYLYRHVFIIGDGAYEGSPNEECFGMMMGELTRKLCHWTLYMEISHLSQKMFGYKVLRANGYFPVRWMSVHNSLHSRSPEERLTARQRRRIRFAERHGVRMRLAESEEDFKVCMKMLRRYLWLKPRRFMPKEQFFREMMEQGHCDLVMAQHFGGKGDQEGGRTIGCAVCVYSNGDAYLWYSASLRKRYPALHPNVMTYWFTILHAAERGCQHIRFMDVGLPFRKNPYRDFILRFGGKEVSTYRWFRISIKWVNSVASWMWRE